MPLIRLADDMTCQKSCWNRKSGWGWLEVAYLFLAGSVSLLDWQWQRLELSGLLMIDAPPEPHGHLEVSGNLHISRKENCLASCGSLLWFLEPTIASGNIP